METSEETDANVARGAVCSAHPAVPATSTCVRCGDFLCDSCRTEGESVCAGCRARAFGPAFPFSRSNFDIGGATSFAWRCFMQAFLPLAGAGAAAAVIPTVVQYSLQFALIAVASAAGGDAVLTSVVIPLLLMVPGMTLQAAFYLGGFRVAIDALEGRAPSFAAYFAAMARTPGAVLQMLLAYAALALPLGALGGIAYLVYLGFGEGPAFATGFVGALVLLVPMLWAWLGVLFGWLELAYDPDCSAIAALGRSWAIARGHRLDIFLMGIVLSAATLAGLLMCCIGYLPALGFTWALHAAVYLGLRRGLLAPVERG